MSKSLATENISLGKEKKQKWATYARSIRKSESVAALRLYGKRKKTFIYSKKMIPVCPEMFYWKLIHNTIWMQWQGWSTQLCLNYCVLTEIQCHLYPNMTLFQGITDKHVLLPFRANKGSMPTLSSTMSISDDTFEA